MLQARYYLPVCFSGWQLSSLIFAKPFGPSASKTDIVVEISYKPEQKSVPKNIFNYNNAQYTFPILPHLPQMNHYHFAVV